MVFVQIPVFLEREREREEVCAPSVTPGQNPRCRNFVHMSSMYISGIEVIHFFSFPFLNQCNNKFFVLNFSISLMVERLLNGRNSLKGQNLFCIDPVKSGARL